MIKILCILNLFNLHIKKKNKWNKFEVIYKNNLLILFYFYFLFLSIFFPLYFSSNFEPPYITYNRFSFFLSLGYEHTPMGITFVLQRYFLCCFIIHNFIPSKQWRSNDIFTTRIFIIFNIKKITTRLVYT